MSTERRTAWGYNLKALRTSRQMSQSDLAEKVGVSVATVSRWESGHIALPDDRKLDIAQALDAQVVDLFPLVRS